jgi:hypothetical protein
MLKAVFISDVNVGESSLPYLTSKPKFSVCSERRVPLDQVHCLFKTDAAGNGHKDVNVIWHGHEVMKGTFPDRMVDRRTSMKRSAMRSVWKRDLPPAVRVVTKKVRGHPVALLGLEGREGFDLAGAKALPFSTVLARLKSCPDTGRIGI